MSGILPDLPDRSRKAVIVISVVAVACVVGLVGWTLFAAIMRSINGEEYPGALLLVMVGGSEGIFGRSLAGLLLIVSYGATLLAGSRVKDSLYYAIVGLSGAGVLATIALMIIMNGKIAAVVARAGTFADVAAYRGAQNVFLGALLVWLIGTLSTQLGIEAGAKHPSEGGA